MTAPTHRQYAIQFAFITNMLLYWFGLTQVNYYLALPILILTAKYGALFPDVDHDWSNVKEKTTPNKIINTLIHITGGKHRSWQTHSIDIVVLVLIASMYLPIYLFNKGYITETNKEILSILMLGFSSGWVSHIISDMLTSAGVRIFAMSSKKIAFVPKRIGKFKFNTGNEWEKFCYTITKLINKFLGIVVLIFPFLIGRMNIHKLLPITF